MKNSTKKKSKQGMSKVSLSNTEVSLLCIVTSYRRTISVDYIIETVVEDDERQQDFKDICYLILGKPELVVNKDRKVLFLPIVDHMNKWVKQFEKD